MSSAQSNSLHHSSLFLDSVISLIAPHHSPSPGKNTLHAACVVLSCEKRYYTAHMLHSLVAPLRLAHGLGVQVQVQGPAAVAQLNHDMCHMSWVAPLRGTAQVLGDSFSLQRCGFTLSPHVSSSYLLNEAPRAH